MYFFQNRLVYLPTKSLTALPDAYGLAYESISLKTSDGLKIHGWFLPAKNERSVLLFFHGNAGNLSDRIETLEIFHRLHLSVLIIDYRGYGQSEGSPTEAGTYLDAEAAWNFLTKTKKYASTQIFVLGRSLGGGIASWIAEKHKPLALILESTFTSIPDVGKQAYPFLPVRLLSRIKYNTLERVKKLSLPILIIHSPEDEVIDFSHGEKLFDAANEPKTFMEICCSHGGGFFRSKNYIPELGAFITKVLAQTQMDKENTSAA